MLDETINELSEIFTGIVHYVFSIEDGGYKPGEVEEFIIKIKNKYFNKDKFGDKLFHKFYNEFREKLYSLPDLNSRTAFVIETIYWLQLSIFENKILGDINKNNTPENNYNNNIIYEFIHITYGLQNRVACKIIDLCEFFYIDFDKAYNKSKEVSRDTQTAPPQKTFTDLFKHPYNSETKIKDLKDILKTYKHIDNNFKWIGTTDELRELATLYWLFKDNGNIINPGKVTPQLKTFYKEFGLIVYTDKEPKGDCTLKNINKTPGFTDTYKHFERIFLNWISKV